MPTDKPVTLAAIAGAHGVTGEVRLKLFGEGVATLKRHKAFKSHILTKKTSKRKRRLRQEGVIATRGEEKNIKRLLQA